jgi:hypothetical protein
MGAMVVLLKPEKELVAPELAPSPSTSVIF